MRNVRDCIFLLYFSVVLFGILAASISAPYYIFAIKYFPSELRYSDVSFGWNIGNALFGGTTPFICSFFVQYIKAGPEYYLILVAILFLIVVLCNCGKKIVIFIKKILSL